jgi:Flp pilus assembly protein TadD
MIGTPARAAAMAAIAVATVSCGHRPTPVEQAREAFQRGYEALSREDYGSAERYFQAAADLAPGDAFVQLDLGVAEQHLGKTDAARAAWRRAIDLGKDVKPRDVTDPRYSALTVSQLAADDLAALDHPPQAAATPEAKPAGVAASPK